MRWIGELVLSLDCLLDSCRLGVVGGLWMKELEFWVLGSWSFCVPGNEDE